MSVLLPKAFAKEICLQTRERNCTSAVPTYAHELGCAAANYIQFSNLVEVQKKGIKTLG